MYIWQAIGVIIYWVSFSENVASVFYFFYNLFLTRFLNNKNHQKKKKNAVKTVDNFFRILCTFLSRGSSFRESAMAEKSPVVIAEKVKIGRYCWLDDTVVKILGKDSKYY